MAYPLPSLDHCVNCGSNAHSAAQCHESAHIVPIPVPLALLTLPYTPPPLSQQEPVHLKQESFSYPGAPRIPAFNQYPSADLLVEDLFKWGQAMGKWAIGFQTYAIQLSEVVKLNGGPFFKVEDGSISVTIQLPDTDKAQEELQAAMQSASNIVDKMLKNLPEFPPSWPVAPDDSRGFPRYSESPAQLDTGVNGGSPTPTRGGNRRGRGGVARERGGSTRGRVTKQRNASSTPKKVAMATKTESTSASKKESSRKRGPKKNVAKQPAIKEDEDAEREVVQDIDPGGGVIDQSLAGSVALAVAQTFVTEEAGRNEAATVEQAKHTIEDQQIEPTGTLESALVGQLIEHDKD